MLKAFTPVAIVITSAIFQIQALNKKLFAIVVVSRGRDALMQAYFHWLCTWCVTGRSC